jgi:nicotinate phosphoribosyltransferase
MFHIASADDIKRGRVTDVYFARAVEVLKKHNLRRQVVGEVHASALPNDSEWGVLAGVEEVAELLQGLPVSAWCLAEGTVFGANDPVLTIEGEYTDWAVYETPLLGLLCQASGAASKAARCRIAAGKRTLVSFGARRMHPALAPMIERSAYIGGCDGVAAVASAELLGLPASGTMPHALILVIGDAVQAFRMYHEAMPAGVPRVCLVDTLCDEKVEALAAAEALGPALEAVRLDTPGSRRGDMAAILAEVRWELDLRGHQHVKLMVSGGLDEREILKLNEHADGYGVGTAISNAPVINLALDLVEVEGKPFTKRGKLSGRKALLRCRACGARQTALRRAGGLGYGPCQCGGEREDLLQPLIEDGRVVADLRPAGEIREYVLGQIGRLALG